MTGLVRLVIRGLTFLLVGVIGLVFSIQAQTSGCDYLVSNNQELRQANQSVQPGETVCFQPGRYQEAILPNRSGQPSQWITYQAADPSQPPILTRPAKLQRRSYIILQNLTFYSLTSGSAWIITNGDSHHIKILNNYFDTPCARDWSCHDWNVWNGLLLQGHHYWLIGNRFDYWWDGNTVTLEADYSLVEENDFSQGASSHGQLIINASNVVVRGNYLRNPWDRAAAFKGDGKRAQRVLVETNLFIDNIWDPEQPRPDFTVERRETVAAQAVKLLVSWGIFRNNLMIFTNGGSTNQKSATSLGMATYNQVHYAEHLRVYHNTFFNNATSHIVASRNSDPYYAEDNHFKNNVFYQSGPQSKGFYAFEARVREVPWRSYRFENNIFADDEDQLLFYFRGESPEEYSLAQVESKYSQVFGNNLGQAPIFRQPELGFQAKAAPENYHLEDLPAFFQAYRLANNSPGRQAAAALTRLTQAASNTTRLSVEDAYYFSDGFGLVEGDEIIIRHQGQLIRRRVTQIPNQTTLVVDQPVSARAGDPIYLAAAGVAADLGIYGLTSEEPQIEPNFDLNGDGQINHFDASLVIACWQLNQGPCQLADFNQDGQVDGQDLRLELINLFSASPTK